VRRPIDMLQHLLVPSCWIKDLLPKTFQNLKVEFLLDCLFWTKKIHEVSFTRVMLTFDFVTVLNTLVFCFWIQLLCPKSRDSSVGVALGYGLDDRGSIPGGCWEFFSKPPRPERLGGPPSLLSNGYRVLFPWG
jgi:hypothetical protein